MIKTGTAESGATDELKNDLIVANMSALREASPDIENSGSETTETKDLAVKFRYHRADLPDELHISQTPVILTVKK